MLSLKKERKNLQAKSLLGLGLILATALALNACGSQPGETAPGETPLAPEEQPAAPVAPQETPVAPGLATEEPVAPTE